MKRAKIMLSLLVASAVFLGAVRIFAEAVSENNSFIVRKVPKQVVLYAIFRGSYDKAGQGIGSLFALAGEKGIRPAGRVSFAYLNNPKHVASEHWLTEIRIPVNEESLKLSGTLGPMTDVKVLPEMEVVVADKPQGVTDPSGIYEGLYSRILRNGYMVIDTHFETFLSMGASGDYSKIKSEIMVPVERPAKNSK